METRNATSSIGGMLQCWSRLIIVLVSVLLCACATQPVWHPKESLVTLKDVHGLFGGDELLIDQSGQTWLRHVDRRHLEKRYYLQLSPSELADLHKKIKSSGILRYKESPYKGGGCLLRIHIDVFLPGKKPVHAAMWDHFDRAWDEPNFTRFDLYLHDLCQKMQQTKAYYQGRSKPDKPLP